MQDDVKKSIKRNIFLKQELESEKLKKSMMTIELETLIAITNTSNNNKVESDVSTLTEELRFLTNKIYKTQVYKFVLIYILWNLCLIFIVTC